MAQNFTVPVGLYAAASNPTVPTPAAGDIYYNTTSSEMRFYNGSTWVALGGGGGAAAAGTLTGTTLASNVVNSSLTSFGASPTIDTPALTLSTTTSNSTGRIAWDNTNSQIEIGNGSSLKVFTADDAAATLTNKTISGASNTISTTGTLTIGSGLSGGSFNGSSNVTISLTNNSVTVNGTAISLGGSGTITAANPNALTIGTGLSGTSYTGASAVTIAIDSTVATLTGTQTLTNKTITDSNIRQPSVTATIPGASYTLQSSDAGYLVLINVGSAVTVSIPASTFAVGTTITLLQQGTGQVTVQASNAGVTNVFSGGATTAAPKTRARYSAITIVQTSSENWYAMGDLS